MQKFALEAHRFAFLNCRMRYDFADCILDTDRQSLTRLGSDVHVKPQVFDLIRLLAENAGQLVTRDQIVDAVWNGRIISESAISARIAAARKAVGDDGRAQRVIQTVPRRGLKLLAATESTASFAPDPAVRVRYAEADDGTTLAYARSGDGPPILMIPYFPSHLQGAAAISTEAPLFETLGSVGTLIRYDQRGTGLSELKDSAETLEVTVEDLRAVADAAGLERFSIYAESGGCLTALLFAATYPERVDRLMLVGGYAVGRLRRGEPRIEETDAIRTILGEGMEADNSALLTAFMTVYNPEGPVEAIRECAKFMQGNSPRRNVMRDRDLINNASVIDELHKITARTLLVHARHDAVHPLGEAQKLAAGIRDAELVIYETANHQPIPGHHLWPQFQREIRQFFVSQSH